MHIVFFGAGAVGSLIGGRLEQHRDRHGQRVTLVARRAHCEAIDRDGLRINDPTGTTVVRVRAVETIAEAGVEPGDLVVLTMKTQHTEAALDELLRCAPKGINVACAQNGVENERLALRRFPDVYGICVMLPASFLEPGVIDANGFPHNAILDIGRYPTGSDALCDEVAATFEASGLVSIARPDVMASKYTKLLLNLNNVIDALVEDPAEGKELAERAREEARAVYAAAGISYLTAEEDRRRRTGVMEGRPIAGRMRQGNSTWQSFARGSDSIEVDWLNGEIVLLGRLHGVPTPVNAMLGDVARRVVADRRPARSLRVDDLVAHLASPD